ncbi:MAG: acyltransferase [bacterium]|nr:acyltransferase [bacterium]
MIVAPHTSNWDFYFGICAIFHLDMRVSWIGKHTLFRWPYGWFMRALGGTPLRRDRSVGRVEQIVKLLNEHEQFILGLAPEGTRRRTERWKTGFYHVAHQAGVPILLTYLDFKLKHIGLGPLKMPTGDVEADLAQIQAYYTDKHAKNPDQF